VQVGKVYRLPYLEFLIARSLKCLGWTAFFMVNGMRAAGQGFMALPEKHPFQSNSGIKPPLLVVDSERFYRSGEKVFFKKKRRL